MQLDARDKRALIGGAVAVTALLAYLLWPAGAGTGSNVELVSADQRPPVAAAAPIQVQPPTTPPPSAAAPAPPVAAVPEGLRLTGVAGSGAIFSFADGTQRFVLRGREVAPGLTLQGVALRHVIIASGGTAYRLGFGGTAMPIQAPAAPVAQAAPGAAPQLVVVPGAPRNALGGPLITDAQQQQLGRQFVDGLEPRRNGARITGWTLKPGVSLIGLNQAGLQPGDVLVSVNGEAVLDQEQVAGLPRQIADAQRVEFEFERGGQRLRRSIEVNPRR